MKDQIKKGLLAGLGAINFSIEKAREAIDKLVERGEISAEQGKKVVEELVERGKKDSAEFAGKVDEAVRNAFDKIAVVSKSRFEKLEARVACLEEKLGTGGGADSIR